MNTYQSSFLQKVLALTLVVFQFPFACLQQQREKLKRNMLMSRAATVFITPTLAYFSLRH
jgi:hypothetical protein